MNLFSYNINNCNQINIIGMQFIDLNNFIYFYFSNIEFIQNMIFIESLNISELKIHVNEKFYMIIIITYTLK